MKTVRYFTEAGLELIGDDIIDSSLGDRRIQAFTVSQLTNNFTLRGVQGEWTIRKFAWRESNCEKPSFVGMIEVMSLGIHHIIHTDEIFWAERIWHWRPLLKQAPTTQTETPEEKAELDRMFGEASGKLQHKYYTPEMHKIGCKVDVGMKFSTGAGEYEAVFTNDKSVCFVDESGHIISIDQDRALHVDVRTDKEKAIAELIEEFRNVTPFDGIASLVGLAYDKFKGE